MNFVLTIYTVRAYREVFLPELDNSDYDLYLRASEYDLGDDVLLPMEVIEGHWRFKKTAGCRIESVGVSFVGKNLSSGQILRVVTPLNESVAIVVWEKPEQIAAYPKYAVLGAERIRIGRSGAITVPWIRRILSGFFIVQFIAAVSIWAGLRCVLI